MQLIFVPAVFGMMASFAIAQHARNQRPWLLLGSACFAICLTILVIYEGIGIDSLKMMIGTLSGKVAH